MLAALERTGQSQDTLVIFTSDNGSPQRDGAGMSGEVGSVRRFGHDPSRPWRGLKADIWEGGHRVPFIACWPGQIAAGRVSDHPLVLVDLMRTIANRVGAALPPQAGEDSFDIGPALWSQPSGAAPRNHLIHHSGNGVFAIRQGPWKLITGRGSGGFTRFQPAADAPAGQLYHLENDPGEQRNLYASQPEIVARLSRLLERYRAQSHTWADAKPAVDQSGQPVAAVVCAKGQSELTAVT